MDIYIRKIIDRLIEIESTGLVSEDQAVAIIGFLRQHLEDADLKANYKIATFYCNWSLHVSLDNRGVQDILDEIFEVLDDESQNLNDRVSEILSLSTLRREFNDILRAAGVVTTVFDSRTTWKRFVSRLLGVILDKPLRRRKPCESDDVGELYLAPPDVKKLDKEYVAKHQIQDVTVFWFIRRLPVGSLYMGPLALTEFASNFKHP